MSDPLHPTCADWVLFDPVEHPPPRNVNLLLINEGGKLVYTPWYDGALAWGYAPKIPPSVKARQTQRLQEKQLESESVHGSQPKSGQVDSSRTLVEREDPQMALQV